jgi:hypothetical protein
MKPPLSKWLVTDKPTLEQYPFSTDHEAAEETHLAVQGDRLLAGILDVDLGMVLKVLADPRADRAAPRPRPFATQQPGPMPERCNRCGAAIGPADTSTSRWAGRHGAGPDVSYSTPVARLPSRRTRRVMAWVMHGQVGRDIAGFR